MRCNGGSTLRFSNRNYNKTYSSIINKWTKELVSLYGTRIDYYVYNYKLGRQDGIYGEDPAAHFSDPIPMVVYAKVNSDSLMLSKFGLQNTAELEVYIPFDTFGAAMGDQHAYPKSGDLIRLTEAGLDRPGGGGYPFAYGICPSGIGGAGNCPAVSGTECDTITGDALDLLSCCRNANSMSEDNETCEDDGINPMSGWMRGPKIYEITSVEDDNIAQGLNPMMTHTMWNIKAIRFDNSYQPDAPVEHGSNMVNDSPYYGKLPGGTQTPENEKLYPQTADKENKQYWDYNKYKLDTVYGGYGAIPKDDLPVAVTYDPSMDPWSEKYSQVFDNITFYDLNAMQIGQMVNYSMFIDNGTMFLQHVEQPVGEVRGVIHMKDISPCISEYKTKVYAVYVYDANISVEYVGGYGNVEYGTPVYTSLYLKDQTTEAKVKVYIKDGALSYGDPDKASD